MTAEFERRIREKMKFLDYAPIVFISAKTGQRVHKVYGLIEQVYESQHRRISTGELNDFLSKLPLTRGGLPSDVKVRYIAPGPRRPADFCALRQHGAQAALFVRTLPVEPYPGSISHSKARRL